MQSEDGSSANMGPESTGDFGMELFRLAGHTFSSEPVFRDRSIRQFMYYDLDSDIVLTSADWDYLNCIRDISLLFSNGSEHFDDPKIESRLEYFSVALISLRRDRSTDAYAIHRILARLSTAPFSIVLFRWEDCFMLSWAIHGRSRDISVVVSDWVPLDAIDSDELIERIDAACFSRNSIPEFIADFEYGFARSYYLGKEPSEFYLEFDLLPMDFVFRNYGDYPGREARIENSRLVYTSPQEQYGYDYVEPEQSVTDEEWYEADDTDLLLLELDLEISEGSEETDDYGSESEEVEDIYGDLDEELYRDPVKMVRWLEKNDKVRWTPGVDPFVKTRFLRI